MDTIYKNSNGLNYVSFNDACENVQFFCTVDRETVSDPLHLNLHVYNKLTNQTFSVYDKTLVGTYFNSNFAPYYSFMETINDSLFGFVVYNNKFPPPGANYTKYGFRIFKYYIDEQALSIKNEIQNNDLSIFPNPGKETFTLQSKEFKGASQITVSNQLGQIIYQTQQKEPNITIQANDWSPGIYFVTVKNAQSVQTLKWIKQ